MKRFDNLAEPRPFSKAWDVKIESNVGTLSRNAKGELELKNYMTWLDMQNINSVVLAREHPIKDINQLKIQCSFRQLLLLLFDQTVFIAIFSAANNMARIHYRFFQCLQSKESGISFNGSPSLGYPTKSMFKSSALLTLELD